ncbi:ABC transporter substrate-binding protein [Pusillimonas sp. MFBS29]|nr:ABC transporter substrate-binding protein [Pusillimonas sp. MFBS29]MCC2595575.1 ABC transporter substrate-binding protein [Pusillimonas sp. MFBS29]
MLKTGIKALSFAIAVAFSTSGAAAGISDDVVKIGVLGDMSGMYSSGFSGPGAVAAVEMAVRDFGGTVLGKKVEVIYADHQNKADVASATARKWFDTDQVDMITDLTNSAVALSVQQLALQKKKITIGTGPGSVDITGKACTKYGIHYGYNTYALATGTASATVKNGGDSWFILAADYAFGHALAKDTTRVVNELGGKVVQTVNVPINTADFSSYLLQAQSSGAKVIGLANAGTDTVNAIKQAHEFGIVSSGQDLAGMLVLLSDVQSMGVEITKGLHYTGSWYWNMDDASRDWQKRYAEFSSNAAPTGPHAALYSATTAYLNAIKAAGTDETDAVRSKLGEMKIDDFFAKGGTIRRDGILMHDMYMLKVKTDGKSEWDLSEVVATIPAEDAYVSPEESECPALKS